MTSISGLGEADYAGCIAGALSFSEYRHGLEAAGFTHVEITPTHSVADGMHATIIRATKPTTATNQTRAAGKTTATDPCCGVTSCCTPAEQVTDPATTAAETKAASGCGCDS